MQESGWMCLMWRGGGEKSGWICLDSPLPGGHVTLRDVVAGFVVLAVMMIPFPMDLLR